MDKKVIGIVSGVVLAAATTGILVSTSKTTVPITEPSVVVVPEPPLSDIEMVGSAIKTSNGKIIHIFGIRNEVKYSIVDSVHGKTAIIENIPKEATCNILVDAKAIPIEQKTTTKMVNNKKVDTTLTRELPDIPKLRDYFGINSWPTKIMDSCTKEGKCLWEILLRGEACKIAGEDPSFVSSSPKEFATLPDTMKNRAKALSSWLDKE